MISDDQVKRGHYHVISAQKQLVEDHIDFVPRMVYAITRDSTKTSAEGRKELCQIGYLTLYRTTTMYQQNLPFKPYTMTAIRHTLYDYWRGVARDRERFCSLENHVSDRREFAYKHPVSERTDISVSPESAADVSAVTE